MLQWIKWPHEKCPECGSSVEIETGCSQELEDEIEYDGIKCGPPYCFCEDRWRCEEGHEGKTYCDSETPVTLEMVPHE